jgi:hypothetical protein
LRAARFQCVLLVIFPPGITVDGATLARGFVTLCAAAVLARE